MSANKRITVALLPKVRGELEQPRGLTGLSTTDIVNRAISTYAFVEQQLAKGNEMAVIDSDDMVAKVYIR